MKIKFNIWSFTYLCFIVHTAFSLSKDINTPRKCIDGNITYTDIWMIVLMFVLLYAYGYLAGRTDGKTETKLQHKDIKDKL